MKGVIVLLWATVILSSCSYQRIGDLTMVSNRNVDSQSEYVLLQRNVEGVAKGVSNDALERAVDVATEQYDGEYMMNVKIYVKSNGKKIRVTGDVWGKKSAQTASISPSVQFTVGDSVVFRRRGKFVDGVIVGLRGNFAMIEYKYSNVTKKIELPFSRLTKTEKSK